MEDTFQSIYQTNGWKGDESVSGQGSDLKQTRKIRKEIPLLLNMIDARSILDIPCGDYYWWSRIKGIENLLYIGADIVPELIYANRKLYPQQFRVLDAATSKLPKVDVIFCRDMLGHLSNADVKRVLKNFRASGSTYLLSTTFPDFYSTADITTGEWRPINLSYFHGLPDPMLLINEECTEGDGKFASKSLGLWKLGR